MKSAKRRPAGPGLLAWRHNEVGTRVAQIAVADRGFAQLRENSVSKCEHLDEFAARCVALSRRVAEKRVWLVAAGVRSAEVRTATKVYATTMQRARLGSMLSQKQSKPKSKKGTTTMPRLKPLSVAAFALLTFLFMAPATQAHAQYPMYLHAISDLRSARWYLQQDTRREFVGLREHAIDEMSRAINDMKQAAIDDGKNPWRTPPPQSGGNMGAPIHSALRLVIEARNDVGRGSDAPGNRGLQMRSLRHIDEAHRALNEILRATE